MKSRVPPEQKGNHRRKASDVAKFVQDPVTKKPVRLSDEEAAKLVARGGQYLSKNEARRMMAALEKAQ